MLRLADSRLAAAAGAAGTDAEAGCTEISDSGTTEPECVGAFDACYGPEALRANLMNPPVQTSCVLTPCPSSRDFKSNLVCEGTLVPEGTLVDGHCCYDVLRAVDGRPFIVQGERRCAGTADRTDWCRTPLDRCELTPAVRAQPSRLIVTCRHASSKGRNRTCYALMDA